MVIARLGPVVAAQLEPVATTLSRLVAAARLVLVVAMGLELTARQLLVAVLLAKLL